MLPCQYLKMLSSSHEVEKPKAIPSNMPTTASKQNWAMAWGADTQATTADTQVGKGQRVEGLLRTTLHALVAFKFVLQSSSLETSAGKALSGA